MEEYLRPSEIMIIQMILKVFVWAEIIDNVESLWSELEMSFDGR